MKTMTAVEYLEARGWLGEDEDDEWIDPECGVPCVLSDALIIQRARDAAEERAAWVQFAAPLQFSPSSVERQNLAGHHADAMLRIYRVRFAVEIVNSTGAKS